MINISIYYANVIEYVVTKENVARYFFAYRSKFHLSN